jgi:hypothetical protein
LGPYPGSEGPFLGPYAYEVLVSGPQFLSKFTLNGKQPKADLRHFIIYARVEPRVADMF